MAGEGNGHNSGVWRLVLALSGREDNKQYGGRKKAFSEKLHLFWLTVFIVTYLYIVFYLYFWIFAWNRYDDLNWKLYLRLNKWIPWYDIVLGLTSVTFAYFSIFMCLFLSVVLRGRQANIHPVHVTLTLFTVAACVAVTIGIQKIWKTEWISTFMSLKITGPFLQIGLVTLLTFFSWFLAGLWFRLPSSVLKVVSIIVFVTVMLFLYTCPIYINSPCVTDKLSPRPKILAHRGASEILPENTLMAYKAAYEYGVWGIESDVQISSDCVPFIMHDRSLIRTTNVREVFPHRALNDASTFTIAELRTLNAGTWFLDDDPRGTATYLSESQRVEASKQTIPTLEELSLLARNYSNRYFMFDLYYPEENHPCYNRSVNVTIDAITKAGYPLDKLLWLEGTFHGSRPTGVKLVGEDYIPVPTLRMMNIDITNVGYTELTDSNIREYLSSNISVNIWVVNSEWMFSLYWCMGITSMTSDRCQVLQSLQTPIWHLVPSSYLAIWLTVDLVSAVIIIVVFFIQRKRMRSSFYLDNIREPVEQRSDMAREEKSAV